MVAGRERPFTPGVLRAMTVRILRLCLASALAVAPLACEGGTTGPGGTASVSVLLTDAPGNVAHFWVRIDEIYLQGTPAAEGGRVVLLDQPTDLIDLVPLNGSTFQLVDDITIPAGIYNQLRIVIGEAILETEEGEVFSTGGLETAQNGPANGDLNCPSCGSSGFKVKLPGGALHLESEGELLVLDFDVLQSVGRERGASRMWVMNPLVTATELEASGAIHGEVALAEGVEFEGCEGVRTIADFVPLATPEADPEAARSGSVEVDGSYAIGFVPPGTYLLGYEPEVEFDDEILEFVAEASEPTVVVPSGGVTVADYAITSAACVPVEE